MVPQTQLTRPLLHEDNLIPSQENSPGPRTIGRNYIIVYIFKFFLYFFGIFVYSVENSLSSQTDNEQFHVSVNSQINRNQI